MNIVEVCMTVHKRRVLGVRPQTPDAGTAKEIAPTCEGLGRVATSCWEGCVCDCCSNSCSISLDILHNWIKTLAWKEVHMVLQEAVVT